MTTTTGASWHTKYRPQTFSDVIGQDAAVKTLQSALAAGEQQAFILEGPSGVGKTTLARICAKELGSEVIEIDAATHTGVDDMREIANRANYVSLEGDGKVFIVDECHRLSRQAWESLLKDIEEPPKGVYWFFCTTEGTKIISTVRSRCMTVSLKSVSVTNLCKVLLEVERGESLDIKQEVVRVAAEEASGSPRQAIVNLHAVRECTTEYEALEALNRQPGGKESIDLARALFGPWNWKTIREIIHELKDQNAEGIRIQVFAYAQSVALNKGDKWSVLVMSEFEKPCIEQNRIGDVLLRCARLNHRKENSR